jgi:hypothetical protein
MLAILLLVLACNQSVDYADKNDWEEANLQGKVRFLKQTTYAAEQKFGQLKKAAVLAEEQQEYNPAGNLIQIIQADSSRSLWQKTVYKYNSQQQKISKKIYSEPDILASIERFVYDSKGRLIEHNLLDSEQNLQAKIVFLYSGKPKKSEKIRYDAEGNQAARWSYFYNNQGQLSEKNHFAADGVLKTKWQYTYDKEGHLQESKTYILDGILASREKYQYDQMGNITNYEKSVSEYVRLERGLESNIAQNIRYEYLYDAKQNWLERREYGANDKPQQIRLRQISYY